MATLSVAVPAAAYTVTYSGNGSQSGTVPVDSGKYTQGQTVTVLGNSGGLALSGYAFAGWTTSTTGPGASYPVGATFTMGTDSVTLYAVWIPSNLTFTSSGTSIILIGFTTAPTGSLTIPGGVTGIGATAFESAPLTSVTIPASVTTIGAEPFYGCTHLTSISVNAANPNYESMSGVLFNKTGTTLIQAPVAAMTGSYTIPASVTTIGAGAFAGCGLTSVTIPTGVTTIGASAFISCTGLTSVTIPTSVTTIGDSAFSYCTDLSSVTIPASVSTIGATPFINCTLLISISVDPANPNYESISGALFNKSGTTLLDVPNHMPGYTIPSSVTSIGAYAFAGCSQMNSVEIPASVTSIGDYAFYSTMNGLLMLFDGATPPSLGNDALFGPMIDINPFYIAAYLAAPSWAGYIMYFNPSDWPPQTPTFSPGAGTYSTAQTVTISIPTAQYQSMPNGSIMYTTDGSTPSQSNGTPITLTSGTVSVAASETLQAVTIEYNSAVGVWMTSAVASAAYVVQ
jgi:uncharacterized repeat protein (TIGR02543 family)